MHEATHADLIAEVDALNGIPPTPGPSALQQTQSKPGQLSKKTISMLTDLTAAASSVPPELEVHDRVLSEEELAERELAAEERRRTLEHSAPSAPAPPAAVGGGGIALHKPVVGGLRKPKGDEKDYDVLIKLLLLGDGGVGKTSLMLRFSEDKFSSSLLATAGVDYKTQFIDVDGRRVKCQIWDTAGQQRFHVITQAYYRGGMSGVAVSMLLDLFTFSPLNVRASCHHSSRHCVSVRCI